MLNISQLAVVMGQDGLYGIHQNLQRLGADLQLLLPLYPGVLLNIKLLFQLPLCAAQPVRAANGQVQDGTLSTLAENIFEF